MQPGSTWWLGDDDSLKTNECQNITWCVTARHTVKETQKRFTDVSPVWYCGARGVGVCGGGEGRSGCCIWVDVCIIRPRGTLAYKNKDKCEEVHSKCQSDIESTKQLSSKSKYGQLVTQTSRAITNTSSLAFGDGISAVCRKCPLARFLQLMFHSLLDHRLQSSLHTHQ